MYSASKLLNCQLILPTSCLHPLPWQCHIGVYPLTSHNSAFSIPHTERHTYRHKLNHIISHMSLLHSTSLLSGRIFSYTGYTSNEVCVQVECLTPHICSYWECPNCSPGLCVFGQWRPMEHRIISYVRLWLHKQYLAFDFCLCWQ